MRPLGVLVAAVPLALATALLLRDAAILWLLVRHGHDWPPRRRWLAVLLVWAWLVSLVGFASAVRRLWAAP